MRNETFYNIKKSYFLTIGVKGCEELEPEKKKALNGFLAAIEKRAFTMAHFAVGDTEEALDMVQDAMLKFVRLYSDRPKEEWKTLFYRILQTRVSDWYRRSTVRKRLQQWFDFTKEDKKENLPGDFIKSAGSSPADLVENKEFNTALEKALSRLPARQQQAFFLRAWEDMGIKEVALAMKCSEGSVKTHFSRAVHTLRSVLEDFVP